MSRKFEERLEQAQRGQGLVEFGLLLALVAVVVIGALVAVSGGVSSAYCATSGMIGADTEAIEVCENITIHTNRQQYIRKRGVYKYTIVASLNNEKQDAEFAMVSSLGGEMERLNKKKFRIIVETPECVPEIILRSSEGFSKTLHYTCP